jgi:hypothetical protein
MKTHAFAVVESSRQSGGRVQHSRSIKAVRKIGRKVDCGRAGGRFSSSLRQRGVLILAVVICHDRVAIGLALGRARSRRVSLELSRGLEVGFFDGGAGNGRDGLVDAERELHSLDRARLGVLAGLPTAFLLSGALAYHVRGGSVLEVGGLQLFDTPSKATERS